LHNRLKVTEGGALSETLQPHEDWRRGLNQSVREFASAAANADEDTLLSLAHTMLHEIGEALAVDCCMLVSLVDSHRAGAATYEWCRPMMSAAGLPFEARALEPLLAQVRVERHVVVIESTREPGPDEHAMAEACAYLRRTMIRAAVIIPIGVGDAPIWAWVLGAVSDGRDWPEPVIEHLQVLGDIVAGGLHRLHDEEAVEPEESASRLPAKARPAPPIKNIFPANRGFEEIIGDSPALHAALARLKEVVNSESNVVLLGETGTGKELFARALHAHGPRRAFPLVSVNCAALPPTLIESELFGHQRGAFTGAIAPRQGRFELAHHGTLFLDEIGDLPMDLQPKLLRVLQEGAFERVGSSQTHAVDVRIVAATHKDLGRAVAEGEFRADLYYRLNVFPIRLPPLRERREDIPALVWAIIRKRQRVLQRHITSVPTEVLEALQRYSWPGNIRELENVIERALIHTSGSSLTLLEGSLEAPDVQTEVGTTLMSVERAHIEEVLQDCRWRINGIGNAAERLGLHPNTLRFRMKKLGIVRREPLRDSRRLRSDHGSQASDRAS
jgi:transcriptional regulator with GAF, ATPase, and Fis domain